MFVCVISDLMFLETSALTGENVEETFLKCARSILTKIESGNPLSSIFYPSEVFTEKWNVCVCLHVHTFMCGILCVSIFVCECVCVCVAGMRDVCSILAAFPWREAGNVLISLHLSGISGMSFDSCVQSLLLFFSLVLLLFSSCHFSATDPFSWPFSKKFPNIFSWEAFFVWMLLSS